MSDSSDFDDSPVASDDNSEFEEEAKPKATKAASAKKAPKSTPASKRKPAAKPNAASTTKASAAKKKALPEEKSAAAPPAKKRKTAAEKKAIAAEEANPVATAESASRKAAAVKARLVGTSEPNPSSSAKLSSRGLKALNGLDMVKKGGDRKNKYLMVMPFEFTPKSTGPVGHLKQLDTINPVMYFEFPQGRLKMLGTLVHPQSSLLLFKPKGNQATCDKVFDSLLVFGDYHWIGTEADNPQELPLPIPDELKQAIKKTETQPTIAAALARSGTAEFPLNTEVEADTRRTSGRDRKVISYADQEEGHALGSSNSESDDD